MKLKRPRYLGWITTAVVVAAVIIYAVLPTPVAVEQVRITRQNLQTTIEADAVVRVRDKFVVAMPATGILERLLIEAGDSVVAGQIVATIIPPEIDARQRSEAEARVRSIESGIIEVRQRLAALSPLIEQARRRAERIGRLDQAGAVSKEQAENARDAFEQLQREADALRARERAVGYETQAARSILSARPGQRVAVRAPSGGVVLRRYEQSERTIMAGMPIIEIGDTSHLEVVIDVLSADAVRVRPGMTVILDGWGGGSRIYGTVRRIEPAARTKVSSLGIEEQRVYVIADLSNAPATLGDGYRAEAAIVVAEARNVPCVPLGALLRDADQWYVLIADAGTVQRRNVTLGGRSALMSAITSGLREGENVIVHPSEKLRVGDKVQ
ncbi:MAG: efflux RND transporter periplasmic adaptor subunit [Candidatus Kapabacteria bacterium]|nr:efflux RND transporter periplasmic adaptor subunit [Candidatus Kapabacteria bacterium]